MECLSESDLETVAETAGRGELDVAVVAAGECAWFDQQLAGRHYLGAGRAVGDYLRQVVRVRGRAVALLVWGPACYALKDRDQWVGWNATQRTQRLKLIVQNRRFLLLAAKGQAPNVASQTLAAALRALPGQWQQRFGYCPLLAESFTDPAAYAGTCYKASNWQPVGTSAGYSRERSDFYVAHEQPKRLWLYPLHPQARVHLCSAQLPADCQDAAIAAPSGVLPLAQPQLLSLFEGLRHTSDPRGKNTRFRIGAVLSLVVLAWLAGQRELAGIARFATTLHPRQRRLLGLPRRKGTGAFYEVPPYGVFSSVLLRVDPAGFGRVFDQWLETRASVSPALALDGKIIREYLRVLATPAECELFAQRGRFGQPPLGP